MEGILLVDKPSGWTSHDVVAKIRKELTKKLGKKIKVGHAGTLDPMATGLLIILIGGYTKRAGQFLKLDKSYDCELTLGKTSTTGDGDGQISHVSDKKPPEEQIKEITHGFVGTIKQTPPVYSAIKIKGQAAYKLARAGKELKMEPRVVTVYSLKINKYEYPKLSFTTKVSSGTYIRSLASDIGTKLGTGAYLSALRRTQIDYFTIQDAIKIEPISARSIQLQLQIYP
jgi:tRNA pseudouridine55 synthase